MLKNSFLQRPRARRQGVSMVLFILSLPVMFGMIGLVIDLTNLYTRRAYAQRAADAAALAGAMASGPDEADPSQTNDSVVIAEAKSYAQKNGYSADQVTVNPKVGGIPGKVQVTVGRDETVFFVPVMEVLLGDNPIYSRSVGATAIAEKISNVRMDLGGNYGTTTGASNPAVFGPYAKHSFGDPYSVLYHDDGTPNTPENVSKNMGTGWDANTHYNPDGFTYTMSVSKEFAATNPTMRVELFDPDGFDSKDGSALDEIHNDYSVQQPTIPETTTRYTIYKVDNTGKLVEVASAEYGKDEAVDSATRKAQGKDPWVTPEGFKLDLATLGAGEFKIRVKSLDGSSENGYNLRAGPDYNDDYPQPEVKPRTEAEWRALEAKWNETYGDKGGADPSNIKVPIQADDRLQMNFTRTDNVKVRLGKIPASAAGQELTVTKFDTDVGSTDIQYSFVPDDGGPEVAAEGTDFLTPTNDLWSQNTVKVPDNFAGGYVYAKYNAGQQDTSSWSMKLPGVNSGSVRLIK
jgi:hypothetical protein